MLGNQAAPAVMMVRPDYFGYNPETAASNSFQQSESKVDLQAIRAQAGIEFDNLLLTLKTRGIAVVEFTPKGGERAPDAVFPNNWVSFHPDGKVVIYPMMAPNRRLERRMDYIRTLEKQHHFEVSEVIDLSHFEREGLYLEGTGSLVIDYMNGIIYANFSPRTNPKLVDKVAEILEYKVCMFKAVDAMGQDIYHTNVLMCIAGCYAVVCTDSITDIAERTDLESSLTSSGHELIAISKPQMSMFAGNMMELRGKEDQSVLVMSQNAYNSLTKDQIRIIEKNSTIVSSPIDTIEKYGGGSVRCMMAGIFLPRKKEITNLSA
jgi:hypothetical protein